MIPLLAVLLGNRSLVLKPLVTGLDRPVQIVSTNDHTGRLLIAEQSGRILVVPRPGEAPQLFLDLSPLVSCCDNGGLLSIAFRDGRLFALYVDVRGDTVVARYTGDVAKILFVVPQPRDNIPNHHGGTLQFGPNGFLYISIGDGGAYIRVTNRAQELDHLLGKLLRIDVNAGSLYAIPPDNPFAGMPGVRGEIWSYGLRNPWRFSFDRLTGELLMGDVGQDSWEEIDIASIAVARGANFGWPRMEGRHCFPPDTTCNGGGLTFPVLEYAREFGCSVTGGYRYRGTKWPALYGIYFYADYCSGRIWAAEEVDGAWHSSVVADTELLIVSFGEDENGELYVVDHDGAVYELAAPALRQRSVRH
ncbi:MAG TPA: PQQ-dependent sugar dehydrogenase [Thermoanaerobaculia bacterium]